MKEAADGNFLLVAAAEFPRGLVDVGIAHIQAFEPTSGGAAALTEIEQAEERIGAQSAVGEVVEDVLAKGEALRLAVFAEQADAFAYSCRWRRASRRNRFDFHLSRAHLIQTKDCAQQFRAARPDDPGDAKNLSAMQAQIDAVRLVDAGQVRQLKDWFADCMGDTRELFVQAAADHLL